MQMAGHQGGGHWVIRLGVTEVIGNEKDFPFTGIEQHGHLGRLAYLLLRSILRLHHMIEEHLGVSACLLILGDEP